MSNSSFDDPWLPEIPAPGRAPEEGLGVFVFPEGEEKKVGEPAWTYVSTCPDGGIDPWLPEIPAPGRPPEEGLGVFVFPEEVEIIDGNPVWTYVSLSPEPKKLKSEIEDTSGGGEN